MLDPRKNADAITETYCDVCVSFGNVKDLVFWNDVSELGTVGLRIAL